MKEPTKEDTAMATIQDPRLGRLGYDLSGEGSTALLMMHGWAGSGGYFDPLIGHLAPDLFYCVSMDLPGHGASGEPQAPYTFDLIADAAIAVADATGADTFVLLGFSMSAKFAQYVALRHPERVLGQILVAGCPTGPIPLPEDLLADWYGRAGDAGRLIEVAAGAATRAIADDTLAAFGRDAARVSRSVLQDSLGLCLTSDISASIKGSSIPTLVVGGQADPIFTPAVLRSAVVDPLARAALQTIDCGHEIPIEAPQELARLMSAFVHGLAASSLAH
jgi:pimeloyl-ACP methyl ester carboxylesterase